MYYSLLSYGSMALFIRLIIRTFQLDFLAGTVFFSHDKSANSVFQLVFFSHDKSANSVFQLTYKHSRTGPIWLKNYYSCVLNAK
jgi:hypothetical protein